MLNNTKTQSRPKLLFLVPAISQTHKSLENSQDFFVKTKTETKTLFFVLEAPRDQDFGLEDYVTAQLSPFSALTLLVGQWAASWVTGTDPACKKLGVGTLVVMI